MSCRLPEDFLQETTFLLPLLFFLLLLGFFLFFLLLLFQLFLELLSLLLLSLLLAVLVGEAVELDTGLGNLHLLHVVGIGEREVAHQIHVSPTRMHAPCGHGTVTPQHFSRIGKAVTFSPNNL